MPDDSLARRSFFTLAEANDIVAAASAPADTARVHRLFSRAALHA
jgi:hypothetical protein